MADYKTTYSTNVNKMKKASETNNGLSTHLRNGKARTDKFSSGWDRVNINDVVEKFAPGATMRESNGKIVFSSGGQFEIVADVAGGYLRIQDVSKKFTYVSLSGDYKPNTISKSKWKQMTHYLIKKAGEK